MVAAGDIDSHTSTTLAPLKLPDDSSPGIPQFINTPTSQSCVPPYGAFERDTTPPNGLSRAQQYPITPRAKTMIMKPIAFSRRKKIW